MKFVFITIAFTFISSSIWCQTVEKHLFIDSPEIKKRKKVFKIGIASTYSIGAIGLYYAWYKKYDQRAFQFYNDWDEWQNMDKMGHIYSSYFQSDLIYQLGKWAGYEEKQSISIACLTALSFQTSFEIMDGFSSGWGFSVPDFTANIFGIGSFYIQQKLWREQRIRMKVSYWPVNYADKVFTSETGLFEYTLENRASGLYGNNFLERIIKDYNGQTIWFSFNLKSFWKSSSIPDWLNLAVGYGANNLYGGYSNTWEINDENFIVSKDEFPRTRQIVFSPDVDFSKIKANSPFLRSVFNLINVIKLPAPSISIDTEGKLCFSLLFTN